jgi:hypothetical protein
MRIRAFRRRKLTEYIVRRVAEPHGQAWTLLMLGAWLAKNKPARFWELLAQLDESGQKEKGMGKLKLDRSTTAEEIEKALDVDAAKTRKDAEKQTVHSNISTLNVHRTKGGKKK